ncbi:phenylalanine--tRNA ligase subunit beta [Aestuariimicrobium sp. T2.26MG-19.2B]|uniref:phenylalanine--tRNA ligase subunit beta n=1 Tax=Aestuariimicrobium sp. T2.26MG-19.2B TaxID=3040679 RepID=UPI0024779A23|nr:phenylalanine--tRNA ligase subunit beta [Aestuariimicrobium sp. T2.26MG-19.2B]CAI9398525.1 Phenylalanine--tRNA ligase beta subunit [Aestuariimicrobium sp. T2.26MG-19.2B]
MRAPLSWLRELVQLPADITTTQIADRWTRAGLNVERIESTDGDVSGPVVIGRVLSLVEEPQKNGKTIRWCRVDVGPQFNEPATADEPAGRGIVCGASNFKVGDHVVVALPGAVLPGDFAIAARKTYGHVSDGMICAEDELGLGSDHAGIMVLPEVLDGRPLVLGDDALDVLKARDEVIEADITPDTGYCLSMRGLARETAQAFGVGFTDPYSSPVPPETSSGHPVLVDDPSGCSLFTATAVTGIDPHRPSPSWLVRRLEASGMRSISLVVDITNYVMLESGQPLHAYDGDSLQGAIVVRRAREGETLTTLDDVTRDLRVGDDLLICDDSGPIGLAGVMGGATTEVTASTTTVVLEAATFDAVTIARAFRAHKLPSEASKRFERGVDPALAWAAGQRAAALMAELAGGTVSAAATIVGGPRAMPAQRISADLPATILGADIGHDEVMEVLRASGCEVEVIGSELRVVPPTWRGDLVDPYDYVEEVGRKVGFERIGSVLPVATSGRGLTSGQRGRRTVGRAAADAGFVELITLPFVSDDELTRLGLPEGDPRLSAVKLQNPLSDAQPYLRTSLLGGLMTAVGRNTSRGQDDLALFEIGSVFHQRGDAVAAPMPSVSARPSEDDIAALDAALPDQPRMLAAIVTGQWRAAGWRGPAVPADWTHVAALAEAVAASVGLRLVRRNTEHAPWHPGRCAELLVGGAVIGHVGELHPEVARAWGLPERPAALELDLDALLAAAPGPGEVAPLRTAMVAKEDVALIVDESVASSDVRDALVEGAGDLLDSVRLFDVYRSEQVGQGKKSLAFALKLRGAATLTDAEAAEARERAVAVAVERFGAVHRA